MDDNQGEKQSDPVPTPIGTDPLTYTSEDLFQGEKVIHIHHGDLVYKILHTRAGKLIMNK